MVLRGYYVGSDKVYKKRNEERFFGYQYYRDFTIADCPIFVTDSVIALSAVKDSRLIKYNYIVRGDEQTGIFEGDIISDIESGELIGYVTYKCGFKVQTLDKVVKNFEDLGHIKVDKGNIETIKMLDESNRSPIRFNIDGLPFDIRSIMCKSGDFIYIVNLSDVIRIDPDKVRISTGLVVNSKELAYGDVIRGGTVVMHEMKPVLKRYGEFIRLEEVFENERIEEYKSSARVNS